MDSEDLKMPGTSRALVHGRSCHAYRSNNNEQLLLELGNGQIARVLTDLVSTDT
jgi:hypothetical protein